MSLQSCIYEGSVRHRRYLPGPHAFQNSLYMMYLDLGELPHLFDDHRLWSNGSPNVASFRRDDHLGEADRELDACVRELVETEAGMSPCGSIRLLTHLRYFGYVFNPVSFYYCFGAAGDKVETIVAEVNNTPWGEQHPYVLPEPMNTGSAGKMAYRFSKTFHVSPFMGMGQTYVWRFTAPGRSLSVHMENWEEGQQVFDATMVMRRREITRGALARVLLRYPLMTARVIGAIHWNALKLWLKRCPTYSHPKWLSETEADQEQPQMDTDTHR